MSGTWTGNRGRRAPVLAVALSAAVLGLTAAPRVSAGEAEHRSRRVSITALPVLDGAEVTRPDDLNEWGVVAATSGSETESGPLEGQALLWWGGWWGEHVLELNPPGAETSRSVDLTDRGHLLGAFSQGAEDRAFVWKWGRFTTPDTGRPDLSPVAMNERGQVLLRDQSWSDQSGLWERGRFTPIQVPWSLRTIPSFLTEWGAVGGVFSAEPPGDRVSFGSFIWSAGAFTVVQEGQGTVADMNRAGLAAGSTPSCSGSRRTCGRPAR